MISAGNLTGHCWRLKVLFLEWWHKCLGGQCCADAFATGLDYSAACRIPHVEANTVSRNSVMVALELDAFRVVHFV